MSIPEDLRYSEEHVWAKHEGDRVLFGITDKAQDDLGDIVFVEFPSFGDEIEAGEAFGSLESVKTVSELYAPIGGRVIEINEILENEPSLLNESPYEEGWIIAVEPYDEADLDGLHSADQYEDFIEE